MDTPATSRKRSASSPLNAEARYPTGSVRSISPLCARRSRLRARPPPPTDNEVILYWYRKGGRNRERNRRILCISPPPLRFVLRLRLQKGWGLLQDTMVKVKKVNWALPVGIHSMWMKVSYV